MNDLQTVAYVCGNTHSGTTLLHRLVGSHPDVVSLGSLSRLSSILNGTSDRTCSCGSRPLDKCTRWGSILDDIATRMDIRSFDPNAPDQSKFVRSNAALFAAARRVTGARVLVDSSRKLSRLARLGSIPGLRVVPLHIFKHPVAHIVSQRRKGMGSFEASVRYGAINIGAVLLSRRFRDAIRFPYDGLCEDPNRVLAQVFVRLGVDFIDVVPNWGTEAPHALGGNRMLALDTSEIRLDDTWLEKARRKDRLMGGTLMSVYSLCRHGFGIAPSERAAQ